ncbi:hypothetical protein AB1Y20_011794 [Prymnesium parvum]|uniref:Uncharacterized protein n=1 Tax=Prymnesium parvum TaxID=97485 RepID=A0AB34IK46_PRYPA
MQVMRHHHIIFLALLITSGLVRARSPSEVFAADLEKCIREHAAAAARTFPQWGDSCMPPTEKIDIQAALYDTTLASIQHTYGYTGSLWCSFYSLRMTGKEYNPNDSQPNNPNYFDWYKSLLCPWDLSRCENEPLGMHGDEWKGVPVGDAPNQNTQYLVKPLDPYVSDEPDRRTMSCGLCGWLKRKLGEPPFTIKPDPLPPFTPGAELYTANWDFHPFGSWLANQAARTHEHVDGIVQNINIWRASNGEEIHGFLWQSTRLLAYESQSLSKQRLKFVDEKRAIDHVLRVCKPSWWLAPQSRDDCSHAAGHGFFYYFLDVGRAVSACWTDEIVDHTPGPELDRDTDTRHSGLNAADLLKWRWLCSTGVYHSAGNTLSSAILQQLSRIDTGAEQFLCKHADSWGDHARFFDRCSAGLGMKETEGRLELVRVEKCKVPHSASGKVAKPAAWELKQLSQFGQTMQLSCNPAKYFVQANDQCPLAYRAHFPCEWGTKDYDFCTGRIGGAIVKGPTGPRGVVWETPGTPPNYLTFYTIKVTTALTDEQVEMIPQTRWAFFDTATKTGLLKYDPEVTREELPEELKETVVVETLLELDHVVLTSLAPIILDNTATVTPYHELCMSHEILRETFRCEHPPPPPEGQAYVKYAEDFVSGYPLGVWGGSCTCPDGRVYTAGDNGDLCGSLACFGGVSGPCQEREGIWAFREV